jgi:aminocarboxymuconate-semialdehyde decarboxylase
MPNRRDFFKTVAGATAGMLADGRYGTAFQEPRATRRTVSIGGRRIRVVDMHAHAVMPDVWDVVKDTDLATAAGGPPSGRNVLGPQRLQTMDQQGVDLQVLSVNAYWWYAADLELSRRIVKTQDEGLAAWCRIYPDRFAALSSVALQHPDLAAEQLEYAVKRLGMRGASVGGHVNGETLSSPRFDPFWAKAQELGVIVFMHPGGAENIVRDGAFDGRGDLENIIGNPLETTVFLSRLIFDGTLDRYPALRICAAHAGGYLPSYLGRTEVACDVRPNAKCANKRRPSEYLKGQVLVDSMIFSEEGLRHLVAEMGMSQIVYGTDTPYNWPVTVDLVLRAPFLSDSDKKAILSGNLAKMLRL